MLCAAASARSASSDAIVVVGSAGLKFQRTHGLSLFAGSANDAGVSLETGFRSAYVDVVGGWPSGVVVPARALVPVTARALRATVPAATAPPMRRALRVRSGRPRMRCELLTRSPCSSVHGSW